MAAKNAFSGFFKATTPQTLIERSTQAARQIISAETSRRDANIQRLRTLRLAKEAQQVSAPVEQPASKKTRKKKA